MKDTQSAFACSKLTTETLVNNSEAHLEPCRTSKMERFVKIVVIGRVLNTAKYCGQYNLAYYW